jgi:hypothetical protein
MPQLDDDDGDLECSPLLEVEMESRSSPHRPNSRRRPNVNDSKQSKAAQYDGRTNSRLSGRFTGHTRRSICVLLVGAIVLIGVIAHSRYSSSRHGKTDASASESSDMRVKSYDPKAFAKENGGEGVHTHLHQYKITRAKCFNSDTLTNTTLQPDNEATSSSDAHTTGHHSHHHRRHSKHGLRFFQAYPDLTPLPDVQSRDAQKEARVATCMLSTADSTWHIQRVGPFVTRGNGTWNKVGINYCQG